MAFVRKDMRSPLQKFADDCYYKVAYFLLRHISQDAITDYATEYLELMNADTAMEAAAERRMHRAGYD